jgi:hypothetical protein
MSWMLDARGDGVAASRTIPRASPEHVETRLRLSQAQLAEAILDPRLAVPAGMIGPDGDSSARRFSVYRNNVVLGLCETLGAAFPVVRRLVGEAFSTATAKGARPWFRLQRRA